MRDADGYKNDYKWEALVEHLAAWPRLDARARDKIYALLKSLPGPRQDDSMNGRQADGWCEQLGTLLLLRDPRWETEWRGKP